ncbi:MAG TPA: TetR/AcrR family transcriptional regulator [Candidatus Margulisiibacteriota bacterium]|nr:TetR/AcrR family transcriptional regulator [Candidatus Margulisiibacteriota bacterium]
MRGRKKTNETRLAIIGCASDIFSEREFHEVLTDDIAQRLGIGKGTIYRYFGSKEELYLAAIGEDLNGLHAAVTAVLQQDAPLETTVEAVVRTMVNYFWRRRDFFVLMQRLEPKLKARERADWRKRRDDVVGMVRRVIERAAARGEIGRVNARLAVEVLFGMIRGVCVYRAESDRPEELTRLVTAIFLGGVGGDGRRVQGRARPLQVVHGGTRGS